MQKVAIKYILDRYRFRVPTEPDVYIADIDDGNITFRFNGNEISKRTAKKIIRFLKSL